MHQVAADFLTGVAASLDPITRFRMTIGAPDPYQQELLTVDPNNDPSDRFVAVLCGRQVGKSTSCASLAYEDLARNKEVAMFAPSQRQAIELLRRVHDFRDADPFAPPIQTNKTEMLRLDGKGRIVTLPLTDKSRGGTWDTIIVDEAAFAEENTIEAILPSRKASGRVFLISTPNGQQGFFYDQWQAAKCRRIFARSVDIPRLKEKVDFDRQFYSDHIFRVEHLCEFLGSGHPLISFDVLERATNHDIGALCLN